MSLHHLINALCSLSLEAMEMAYGNNKVKSYCILVQGEIVLHASISKVPLFIYFLWSCLGFRSRLSLL